MSGTSPSLPGSPFAAFLKRRWLATIVVVAVVVIAANRDEIE